MLEQEDSQFFANPLVPQDHGVSKDEYETHVKQPIDLGTIRSRLESQDKPSAYQSVSGFSKDLNRVFANVLKVWKPGQDIADAARRLQAWWIDEWTNTVPILMSMKSDDSAGSPRVAHSITEGGGIASSERGDNFQEQIGMPDEENMRCWSHHHTVETVDDPIFRAAMRGFDSVSFVFGLEVTWSLIQQQKQEDEEKQAMLELEEAQRCNPEEGLDEGEGSSDESVDETKLVASNAEVDLTTGAMVDVENTEQHELSNASDDRSLDLGEGDATECMVSVSSSDASLHVLKDKQALLSDGQSQDIEVDTDTDGISVATKNESTVKWICTKCTYYSSPSRKTCGMCRTKRESPVVSETWICQACTFVTAATRKTCGMCATKRERPAKKQRVSVDEE